MFPGSEDDGPAVNDNRRQQGFLPEEDAYQYIQRVKAGEVRWAQVDTTDPNIAVLTDEEGWEVRVALGEYGPYSDDFRHYEEIVAPDGASWVFDDGGPLCGEDKLPHSIVEALRVDEMPAWTEEEILRLLERKETVDVPPGTMMQSGSSWPTIDLCTVRMRESVPFTQLAVQAHSISKSKGWWDREVSFTDFAALVHCEVSEAVEEVRDKHRVSEVYLRNGKPEGVPIELADIVIRVMDYCQAEEIDLEAAIRLKMAYNKTRPHRHGGKAF